MKYGLLKVTTPGEVLEFPLDLPSLVVGRAQSSDLRIDDPSIARRHARLSFDSGRFFIEDLGSASGTFIDGYRIEPGVPALAGPGQELRFGDAAAWYEAPESEDVALATAAPAAAPPADSFDTAIRASLTSPVEPLDPGGAARVAVLSLANRGRIVDDFAITVDGLPPEWLTLSRPSVSLLPGDSAEVQIAISPPRHEFSEAGVYDFTVTVASGQGGREVVLPGKVEVTPFRDVAWSLAPVRAKRDFRVIATNRGNSREVFRLEGQDDEESLRYVFQQPAMDLPPGGEGAVAFRVAPRKKPYFGAQSVRPFRINATSVADGTVHGGAMGQLVIHPPLQPAKRGAMFALMFCVAIAIVTLVVVIPDALFGGGGGAKTASAEEAFKGVHLCDDEGKAEQQQKAAEELALSGPPTAQGATAASLGAPFYAQNDPRWGDVEYAKAKDPEFGPDWCGSTIAQCGCAMTSVATMLAIYGVLETPDGEPLSPQSLNAWFNKNARRTNRGWVSQGYIYGDVIWTAANQLSGEMAAKKPGTRTVRFLRTGTGSEEEVRQQLQLGRPVVLEVPGHWIAATGLVGDKIQINDPFYRDRTTLDAYKGKVRSSVLFEPSEDLSAVVITVPADVRVRVTDKDGHEVGTLNTGTREDAAKSAKNEIPGASYSTRKAWRDPTCIQKAPTSEEGTNQIVLPGRREDYKIEVLDTAGGATNVAIHTYDKNGQPTVQVLENPGAVVASLNFDPEKPPEIKVVEGQQPTAAGSAQASATAAASASPAATNTPVPGALKPGETNMTVSAPAGATRIEIANNLGFALGDTIRLSPGAANEEDNVISGFGSFLLATPLKFPHTAGEPIIRLSGAGGGTATPSTTPPPAPPPAEPVEPQSLDLACTTTLTDAPKLATLICSVRIEGDYTTTRWTVNGNVQNPFTGQTALFATYTQDTSAAIAVSACNRTACKSVATSQAVRFTPQAAATTIAAVATPTPTVPPPPAVGVTVVCSRKFDQESHAVIDCDALTRMNYTSVTWNISSKYSTFVPVTETDNHLTFKLTDATPDDAKGFANIDFQATACTTSTCEVSPPFRMPVPVANVTVTVLPNSVSMNRSITLFAVISGGEAPAGGYVRFFDTAIRPDGSTKTDQIALDVPITEFATFAIGSITVATGNFPLDVPRPPDPRASVIHQIRARFEGGKNILRSPLSKPVPLEMLPPADDVCDSLDNDGDGVIDANCEFAIRIGAGTQLSNITLTKASAPTAPQPDSITVAPGEAVTVTGSVSVAAATGGIDFCPNCTRQIYLGIGANIAAVPNRPASAAKCVAVAVPTGATEVSLPATTFTADNTPGLYYIRATSSLQSACGNPPTGGPETSVARVIVRGEVNLAFCTGGATCTASVTNGKGFQLASGVTARPPASGQVNVGRIDFWESVPGSTTEEHVGFALVHGDAASTQLNTNTLGILANGSRVGTHRLRAIYTDPGSGGVSYFNPTTTRGAYALPAGPGVAPQCGTAPDPLPAGCFEVVVVPADVTVGLLSSTPSLALSAVTTGACLPTECVRLSAQVSPADVSGLALGVATGYIQFLDGTDLVGTAALGAQGSANLDVYPANFGFYTAGATVTGARSLTAKYCPAVTGNTCIEQGDYKIGTSASTPVTFTGQPTNASLTVSPGTRQLGVATPVTAGVTLDPGGYGNYPGTIELYDGAIPIYCAERIALSCDLGKPWLRVDTWTGGSSHTFSLSFGQGQAPFGAGAHTLAAVYVPATASNYLGARSADRVLTVTAAQSATTLQVTAPLQAAPCDTAPATFVVGCAINLVATVDAAGFGGQAGVVEFRRNGTAIGQANVSLAGANPVTGTATLALDGASTPFSAAALPGAGTAHQLTAHFLGAGNYAASDSAVRSLKVDPGITSTNVTVSRANNSCAGITGNPALGEKVLLTATVTGYTPPGAGAIAGTVEFFDTSNGNLSLGSANPGPSWFGGAVNLCVTATTANLATGSHTISAAFTSTSGDHANSASATDATIAIDPAPTEFTLTSSSPAVRLSPAGGGACLAPDCVAITAFVVPGAFGAHAGSVQFFDQSRPGAPRLATIALSNQQATLDLRTGAYPAIYPTDGTPLTGNHTISARYCPATDPSGVTCTETGNYLSTPAAPLPAHQKVIDFQPQTTTVDLTLTPATVSLGSATPVAAAVSLAPGGFGAYDGTLQLLEGQTVVACVARVVGPGCANAWPSGETNGHTFSLDFSTPGSVALPGGAHALTARYTSGGGNYAGGISPARTLTVEQVASTTTVDVCVPGGATCTAPTLPYIVGTDVDLLATVSANGFGTASGTVEFRRGYASAVSPGTLLGTATVNLAGTTTVTGSVRLNLTGTSTPKVAEGLPADPAAHAITAHFLGGGSYAGSASAATNFTVTPKPTTVTVQATKATSACAAASGTIVLGDPVLLTALVVVSPVPGARAIAGTVEFRDTSAANVLLGTAFVVPNLAGGSASHCVYTSPSGVGAGNHTVSATFVSTSGDYAGSASTTDAALAVDTITTATTVSMTPNAVPEGGSLTLSATVAPGTGMPYVGALTGNVEFRAGYVSEASQGTLLATAALAGNAASTVIPSISLAAGAQTVTARYVGDSSYKLSASTAANLTVLKTTTVTVTATPNPIGYGANLSLQADVSGYTAALGAVDATGGKVDFYRGSTLLGTDTSGTTTGGVRFTLTVDTDGTAAMTPGTYGITAVYSGNAAYATATSAPIGVQVNAAATTLTINTGTNCTGGNATIALAGTVDLCATLTPASFGDPTANGGAVSFFVDGVAAAGTITYACGASPLTACGASPLTAKITLTSSLLLLDGGSHFISAAYSGNSSYLPSSTASGLTVTVTPAPTAATVAFQAGFTSPFVVNPTGTALIKVAVAPSPAIAYSPNSGTVVLYSSPSGTGGWTPVAVSNTYDAGTSSWLFNLSAGPLQVLLPGNHYLAAQYLGNDNFAASAAVSGPGLLLQIQPQTIVSVSFSMATPIPNSTPFTVTATLGPGGLGGYCGTVTFSEVLINGSTVPIGTGTQAGPNMYTFAVPGTRFPTAGNRTIRASITACGPYTAGTVDQPVTFS
ncbi:MAG: Ig-like domain repeat protein [Dehalococcoidia bacterium]|nr:Ig-like domain repeat protein [Dehalococcoidia bacterium]